MRGVSGRTLGKFARVIDDGGFAVVRSRAISMRSEE